MLEIIVDDLVSICWIDVNLSVVDLEMVDHFD
jgi:hypothetical protein